MTQLALALLLLAQGSPPQKQVSLWVARDIAPAQKVQIQLQTQNVRSVQMEARKITLQQWAAHEFDRKRPQGGALVKQWTTGVAGPNDRPPSPGASQYYSRQVNLPALPPGLYTLTASGEGASAFAVVNVTHLSILSKQAQNGMLVWVTDAKTGNPKAGAVVSTWRRPGTEGTGARTDREGIAQFDPGPTPVLVAARFGDDLALQRSGFQSSEGRLSVHVQTDRPIYRPGQTVQWKAIVRARQGSGFRTLPGEVCQIRVLDPFGDPAEMRVLKTNALGTLEGSYSIPRAGAPGSYGFEIRLGDQSGHGSFAVQEYRKPEFKVTVQPKQKRYLAGDMVEFEVDAQYYFGVPVQQGSVRYTVRRDDLGGGYDDNQPLFFGGDGNLYPSDRYGGSPVLANDEVHTDANGKALIRVPSQGGQPDAQFHIECSVTDVSRRVVSSSSSVPVYGAQRRIFLSSSLTLAPLGSLFPLQIELRDLDGRPQPGAVNLTLVQPVWNDKTSKYDQKILTTTRVGIGPTGGAKTQLPAAAEGVIYVLAEADDGTGRKARATFAMQIADPKTKAETNSNPTIRVKLDKRTYAPGDTVNAYVETNVAKRPILLTLEGAGLFWHRILPPGRGQFVKVPLGAQHTPNVYLVASVWSDGDLLQDGPLVPVPDLAHKLQVSVTPDKAAYRPGDTAQYTVLTRDAGGKPVAAEVGLGVVDEAIYGLMADNTVDPYAFYWGRRSNEVSTSYTAPQEMSGGAYQRANPAVPLRQRFEDTAFWNARVTTGADGKGSVTFEMPGNLTTWRATARAIDGSTRAGSAVSKAVSNRPVMLRLATPRQLVAGDELRLIGTVSNRTDLERSFTVHLATVGVTLVDGPERRVMVPPNAQVATTWLVRADGRAGGGSAVLTASIGPSGVPDPSGEFSDALRMTVPIVPNGYGQTVLAGGVFDSALDTSLALPPGRLAGAGELEVEVYAGLGAVAQGAERRVMEAPLAMPTTAAAKLRLAAAAGLTGSDDAVREPMAFLARTFNGQGWGWLEGAPMHARITAHVLEHLLAAKAVLPSDRLVKGATQGVLAAYRATNLWEDRALLASVAAEADAKAGTPLVDEVLKRGVELSPYARLRLAAALARLGRGPEGLVLVKAVMAGAKDGPSEAFVPSGFGMGWSADEIETTTQALQTLAALGHAPDIQQRLARWIARSRERWLPLDSEAAIALSLGAYAAEHPGAKALGEIAVTVDGQAVPVRRSTVAPLAAASAKLPATGDPRVVVRSTSAGELFYTVRAKVFLPPDGDHQNGALALRRFEVRGLSGLWEELDRPIRPGEPVRCTVVVWGDDVDDLLQVVEPLPAGFEHVDSDRMGWAREEVRDGAVIHFVPNSGTPQVFRYYLRSEAEGELTALPVTVESIRRPAHGGRSGAMPIKVVDPPGPSPRSKDQRW